MMISRWLRALSACLLALLLTPSPDARSQDYDGKDRLDGYPEVTLLIEVKDARKAADLVKKAGGEIVYDPNLGVGHDIPFLVIDLPGEKIVDEKFLKSLDLRAGVSPFQADCACSPQPEDEDRPIDFDSLFVPLEDIHLPQLRERVAGAGRGRGVRVAVIDTGVDASHPVFQDRVVYWADATREGRISLEKVRVLDGKVTFQDKQLTVPKRIAENKEIYVGVFDEQAMGIQFRDAEKTAGRQGLDFNRNGSVKDRFLVLIGVDAQAAADAASVKAEQTAGEKADKQPEDKQPAARPAGQSPPLVAFVDTDGDGAIKDKEVETAILDFNTARKQPREAREDSFRDLVVFPSRRRTIAYPLLFRPDAKGNLSTATLCVDFRSHGTHVAGIIAGHSTEIQGAAPEAEIMAIKACSGISCTESAILRGLLEAFFNPLGYVPDVVNISLGSPEQYHKDRMDILIQDLGAKFGTVFFVSASNGGSGYRSINHIGSLSPAVLVGASVSRATLARHYQLQEGVDVPEHCLLHFTSLGPSYTGQLRPNIVAPGSALSATALIDDGSAMYNGTSMSSPIAAGATAALLSLVRRHPDYARLEQWRQAKIEAVRKKSADARYSVTPVPLAVRKALEESATELPGYTLAQQGHGLLDIDAAHDRLIALAGEIAGGDLQLAEFQINGNREEDRLYDRSNNIPPVKSVNLSLDEDGELAEEAALRLRNAVTEVRLDRVQVQSIDGTVQNLEGGQAELPFSIALPGREGLPGRAITLVFSNRTKSSFLSLRKLAAMEPGKTYVAQYDLYQRGERLFTLLDVVHVPLELSDLETEVNLPGVEVEESDRVACFINPAQPISAMQHHRYPVALTARDAALNVEIGFRPDQSGLLLVQVYDPDGYVVGARSIRKSSQLASEDRAGQLVIPARDKEGIYEVTVSSYSGSWVAPSAYELLLEAYRFVASVERLELGSERAGSGAAASERIVSLMNSSRQVGSVSLLLGKAERIAPIKPFGIVPTYRTYKKLPLPAWDPKLGGVQKTTLVLELDEGSEINEAVSGRIDHQLYKQGSDGKFTAAYKAEESGSSSRRKLFKEVPRPEAGREAEPLYAAMEVFTVDPDGPSLSQLVDHVDMLAVYPDLAPRFEGELSAALLGKDSTRDVKLLRVKGPAEVIDETTKPASRSSTATLKVATGDASLPEISLDLPVKLTGPARPASSSKATERVRTRLEIKTDHEDISITIPIVISQ